MGVSYLTYEKVWAVFTRLAARKGYTIPDKDELGCHNKNGETIKLGKIIGEQVTLIEKGVKTTHTFAVLEEWADRVETAQYLRRQNREYT